MKPQPQPQPQPQRRRRRYGRQAVGRTTVSASIDAEVACWMQDQARAAGLSMSEWLNHKLLAEIKNNAKDQPTNPAL